MNSDSPETNSNSDVNEPVTIEANVAENATVNPEDANNQTQTTAPNNAGASESTEIKSLKAQLDERSSQYMRIAADFENYRKRTLKEKDDLELQVKRNTITELLPIIDNFERARAQIKPQNDGEMAIHKSYQGVYKQLVDSLKRLGVSPMRPEGQEFDPNEHEAVMREPTDEYPEGTVLEELVRGYFLGDRVLRHAMVKVAAQKEDSPSEENSQSGETST
ncbi:molecular chaperone GrpE (heat shock protein) [Rivularia sp. PCC 7116]|uniref:nucleotide exchange factor GrpE n=1 Tax=Rivularia sp. PCC 7116 TaxID=373994 RepID=UPI00029ED0C6|nr:nucleotide exchange factor GrpE [Rivularia sp. PCC 7116]AFY52738.1 molecular chaperone GrpE (heat shock protein) [Rivularia sp. PCC 7116]